MKKSTIAIIAIAAIAAAAAGCGKKTVRAGAAPETETAAPQTTPQTAPQTAQTAAPARQNTAPVYNDNNTFTDTRDNQTYRTAKIGELTWMAQNLNFKTGSSQCLYEGSCEKFGRLYDWSTAMTACPAGWRLSTAGDWSDLMDEASDGDALKSKSGWDHGMNGTDDHGFTALPAGGLRNDGKLSDPGCFAYWWTTEEADADKAKTRVINCNNDWVTVNTRDKNEKFYARCVRE